LIIPQAGKLCPFEGLIVNEFNRMSVGLNLFDLQKARQFEQQSALTIRSGS